MSIAIAVSFAQPAIANVELSYSITRASPSAVKSATAMTAAEGSFNSTTADPEKSYDSFDDLYAAISYADTPASTWGLFYKKQQPEKSELSGKNSAGTVLVKKSSTLEGWTLGLARKYYWQDRASRGLNLFLELQLAVGSVSFNQKITDTTAVVSKIEGTAFAFETNAYLGFQYPLWGMLDGLIKVGYARMHSNYFTVKSVSGSRYGTLQAGDRMAIRAGGQDMRLERDGYSAQLGITYSFSGSGGGGAAPPPP